MTLPTNYAAGQSYTHTAHNIENAAINAATNAIAAGAGGGAIDNGDGTVTLTGGSVVDNNDGTVTV